MNLVSLAMQYLGPVILSRMASSLGLGQGLVGKAVAAAIPTILAGLANTATRPGGASALGNVLSKVDPSILGNLGSLIGGSGQQQLVDSGSSALSSLLGGSATGALANAVGRFAGIDGSKSASLMGMLAPVVLGTLAKEQKSSGLDASGVASLLASQKQNIAAAMPAGFGDMLQGSGLLDGISDSVRAAAPNVAPPQISSGGSMLRWLLPLAIALAGIYLLMNWGRHEVAEHAAPPAKPAATEQAPAPKAEAPAPAQVDYIGLANKAVGALTGTLGSIKDEASAKAALPALGDAGQQITALKAASAALQGDARKPLATVIAAALPGIGAAVEKATGIPGVGAIIQPVVEPIVANLTAMSK